MKCLIFPGFWDPYILPFQMPRITPVDAKVCKMEYLQILKALQQMISRENSTCSSPEPCASGSTPAYESDLPDMDEDSKMSAITLSSIGSSEETVDKRGSCLRNNVLQPISSGKNPRKSPRQHASTLAILSSLLYQRKRRSKSKQQEEPPAILPTIPEEFTQVDVAAPGVAEKEEPPELEKVEEVIKPKAKPVSPQKKYPWRFKPKLNYQAVAQNIENELDSALDDIDKYCLDLESDSIDFHNSRVNTHEILRIFEEGKAKETDKSCRRFFNGTPGRKPGRKRKKNLTGWPNKNKRAPKREHSKDKIDAADKNSVADSTSVHEDSDADDAKRSNSVKRTNDSDAKTSNCEAKTNDGDAKTNVGGDVDCCDIDRVSKNTKILRKSTKGDVLQPYVYVQKLDNKLIGNQISNPKRTVKKRKCVPGSPKSPRKLRKPRGRWYKER